MKLSHSDTERIVHVNGVDLCVEIFGDRADPAILLIGGATASMDWWEDDFCRRLADGPRFVIRYDSRDTGRSVTYEAGAPPYSQLDMTADALGVLEPSTCRGPTSSGYPWAAASHSASPSSTLGGLPHSP